MLATPVDSLRRLLSARPRSCATIGTRAGLCAIVCGRARGICGFGAGLSVRYRPQTALRSAFPRLLLGLCVECSANSSHDGRSSQNRLELPPGATLYYQNAHFIGASYRERNHGAKHPERTNGTPRCASVAFPPAQRSASSHRRDAHHNDASGARGADHVLSTGLSSVVRPQPDGTRRKREPQRAANETSTGHNQRQPVINKRQRNVNGHQQASTEHRQDGSTRMK